MKRSTKLKTASRPDLEAFWIERGAAVEKIKHAPKKDLKWWIFSDRLDQEFDQWLNERSKT